MITYDLKNKYVLACSFGPDSMALFAMLYKAGYNFVVAHVNYHKRDVSDYEEQSLSSYCKERNIPFFSLDARKFEMEGNFQAWARDLRYNFFKEVYNQVDAKGLFVAHHLDDLLETYIMQKERRSIPQEYGLKRESIKDDMLVLRPLLDETKDELLKYCIENGIPYSIDESNLNDDYRRNQIRHQKIENMSKEEKLKMLEDVQNDNELLQKERESIDMSTTFLNEEDLKKENASLTLRYYLMICFPARAFSEKFIQECLKALKVKKNFVCIKIDEKWSLIKDYGIIKVSSFLTLKDYQYVMEEPTTLDTPYFKLDFSNSFEDRRVKKENFPITIRNINDDDIVTINGITKNIAFVFAVENAT